MFKVLVVEDDRDQNQTVCSFLNQVGYEAVGCLGANEAYDVMYENTFDLIVSDIMMPGIDGYEFAKTLREMDENIPILFMTARDDFASKQRSYRIGIDDYIVQSVDPDDESFVSESAGAKDTWGVNYVQIEGGDGYIYIKDGSNGIAEVKVVTNETEEVFNDQANPDRWFYEVQNLTKMILENNHDDNDEKIGLMLDVMEVLELSRKFSGILFLGD